MDAPSAASLRTSLDEIGIGSMSKNSTRSGQRSSDRTVVELLPRIAGPRGDAEADVLEDLVRLAPRQELRELVGADEEDRVLAEAGHGVDRVRVVVADDRVVREREPREVESSLDIDVDAFVRWVRRDVHAQRIDVEAALRGFGEQHVTVVRRIERPA